MKAQTAVEYLVTYSWAIIIIAIALAVLFATGAFNPYLFAPKALSGACQVVNSGAGATLSGQCNNGIPKYAAYFAGPSSSTSYVPIPYATTIDANGLSQFSISAWVNPSAYAADPDYSAIAVRNFNYYLELDGNGHIIVALCGVGGYECSGVIMKSSSAAIPLKSWSFVSFSYCNGCGGLSIYINGRLDTNYVLTGNIIDSYGFGAGNTAYLAIGANANSVGGLGGVGGVNQRRYNGYVSNLQMYNISLTQADFYSLYKEGIGGDPIDTQDLMGWWQLNGDAGDYTPNKNAGSQTILGNAVGPSWVSSWYGGYAAP